MSLPQTGVQLVAQDSDKFAAAMSAAQSAVDSFGGSAQAIAGGPLSALGGAAQAATGLLGNLGGSLKTGLGIFGQFGAGVSAILNPLGSLFDRVFNQVFRVLIRQAVRDVENFIGSLAQAAIQGSALETDFGRLKASLDNVSKVSFAPLVNQLGGLVEKAAPAFLGIVQAGETYLGRLGSSALVWGQNVVNQFAQGMLDALGSVLSALASIANLITGYLEPGSPPKLLPDIDKWGTAAANEFFKGWGKADFGVFNDIAGTIQALIQSIPTGSKDTSVIPRILGAREEIAAAVEQLRTTGTIATQTIDQIAATVGTASAQVKDFLAATIHLQAANENVTTAQAALNAVTQTYNNLLRPVNAQIDSITEAQQQLADQQKKSLLQLVLQDPNATAAQKRDAQLQIEKIDADARQRALLAEQKTAVDTAQTKLDAAKTAQQKAQDEYDAKLALLKLDTDQNDLLKQQLQLLQALAKAAAAGGGGGGARFQPFQPKPFDLSKLIPPELLKKWQDFVTALGKAWDAIAGKFQPTIDAINQHLIPSIEAFGQAVNDKLPGVENEFAKTFAFMVSQSAIAGPQIVDNISKALDGLTDIIKNHGDTIIGATGFVFRAIYTAAVLVLTDISASFATFFTVLATVLDTGSLLIQGKFGEAWDRLKQGWTDFWTIQLGTADTDLTLLLNLFGLKWQDIKDSILSYIGPQGGITLDFSLWLVNMGVWLTNAWSGPDGLVSRATQAWESIRSTILSYIGPKGGITLDFSLWLVGLATTLHDMIYGKDGLLPKWQGAWDDILGVFTGFQAKVGSAVSGIVGQIDSILGAAKDLWNWLQTHVFQFPSGSIPQPPSSSSSSTSASSKVRAPASVTQGLSSSYSYASQGPTFVYSPTYNTAPASVAENFSTLQAMWA